MEENKESIVSDKPNTDWNTIEFLQRVVRNADRELERPKASFDIQSGIPDWVHKPTLSFLSNTMVNTEFRHIPIPGVFVNVNGKVTPVDVIVLGTFYQDHDDHIDRAVHTTLLNKINIDGVDYHERLELVGFIQRHAKSEVGVVHGMVLDSKSNKPIIHDHHGIAKAAEILSISFKETIGTSELDETIEKDQDVL